MTRSTRGAPISTDVYLRGKSPLWTRSVRAIARSVTLTPPPPTKPARPVHSAARPRPAPTPGPTLNASTAAPAVDQASSTPVATLPPPIVVPQPAPPVGNRVDSETPDHHVSPGPPVDGNVTIVVVDPDEVVRTVLKDHITTLQLHAVTRDSLASLAETSGNDEPRVFVLGPSEAPQTVIEWIGPLIASRPHFRAVMLVSELSAELVRSAFRAGIDDVVALSAEHTELLDAISRSVALVSGQQQATARPNALHGPVPAVSVGRVVTVFGTKGGTGKSVVAVNLAVSLARQTAQPVVLVDANLQFGDAAIMLQLRPEHTITEAALAGDRLDADVLENLLLRHKPSGLRVLAAPADPMSADQIDRADLLRILTVLRERFAYIVVDTSPRMDENTLVILHTADDVVVLTTPDVMSLKNARLGLQTLHALDIPRQSIKLVLNQVTAQAGLTRADAERAMRMKVDATLPCDHLVGESVNRGSPAILSAPSSKFVLGIEDLARSLRTHPPSTRQPPAKQEAQPQASLR
jgi:pilus assembly protein CpaE